MTLRHIVPIGLVVLVEIAACTEPAGPPATEPGNASPAFSLAGQYPFHGSIAGTVHAIQPFARGSEPACNANFTGDPEAPGASITLIDESNARFSHIGAARLVAVSCIDPNSPFSSGHGRIRTASGDLLWIAFDNFGLPDADDPTIIRVTGTQQVSGGTGRYSGASGTQNCAFTIRLLSPDSGAIVGECHGTLDY